MFSMAPDPEEQERLQREHDRQHELARERAHRLEQLLYETLGADDLFVIGILLNTIANSSEPNQLAAAYHGQVIAIQKMKYQTCTTCGERHTTAEEFLQQVTPEPPSIQSEEEDEGIAILAKMEEYRVHLTDRGMRCKECDYPYSSLDDRMQRKPEDCPGCWVKSAHG